jgi:hypothetical protein
MRVKQLDGLYELDNRYPFYLITFAGSKYACTANGSMDYIEDRIKRIQKNDIFLGDATVIVMWSYFSPETVGTQKIIPRE